MVNLAVRGALEITHVFNYAQNGGFHPFKEADRLAGVNQRHFLRGGHYHHAVQFGRLDNGQLNVSGAGRQVQNQKIHIPPCHVAQELLDVACRQGTAHRYRIGFINQQPHGKKFHAMGRYRDKFVILIGSGAFLGAEHQGHGRAVNIQVHQTDGIPQLAQGHRQVRGNGGFAHAALAGSHGNDMLGSGNGGFPGRGVVIDSLPGFRSLMLNIDVTMLHAGQMFHHAVNAFKNVTGNIRILALNHQINRDVVFSVNVNLFHQPERYDVAAEPRKFYRGQRSPYQFRSQFLLCRHISEIFMVASTFRPRASGMQNAPEYEKRGRQNREVKILPFLFLTTPNSDKTAFCPPDLQCPGY